MRREPGAELFEDRAARRPPELEEFVRLQAARATEPYRDLMPAHVLDELESFLASALACHPVGIELVARARPRAVNQRSEERATTAPLEPAEKRRSRGGGDDR
jgi:hypothetical protein